MDEYISKLAHNPINIKDEPNYCEDCGEVLEMHEGEEVCIRCTVCDDCKEWKDECDCTDE